MAGQRFLKNYFLHRRLIRMLRPIAIIGGIQGQPVLDSVPLRLGMNTPLIILLPSYKVVEPQPLALHQQGGGQLGQQVLTKRIAPGADPQDSSTALANLILNQRIYTCGTEWKSVSKYKRTP